MRIINGFKVLFTGILMIALMFGTYASAFAAGGSGSGGSGGGNNGGDPVTLVGSYLTSISGNSSTTGKDINGNVNVDPNATIKLVFDKNVVSSTVWDTNSQAFTLTDVDNNNIAIAVNRIPDEGENSNPNEKRHIFINPVEPLTLGKTYTITIKSSLTANNTSQLGKKVTITFTVKTDITPPKLTVNKDIQPITNKDRIVVSGSTEAGSFVKINNTDVVVDENGDFSQEVGLVSGLNKISIRAMDGADNITTDELEVTYDNIAPILTITSPKDNSITDKDSLTVTGTSEKDAIVTVNGTLVQLDQTNTFTHTLMLVSGINTITITSTDALGNTSTSVVKVTFEEKASEVVTPPVSNGNVSGTTNGETVKSAATGNKLPNTATNMYYWLFAGMLLLMAGAVMYAYPKFTRE